MTLSTPRRKLKSRKLIGLYRHLVKISPHFVEPEGSLPHSHERIICPPAESQRSRRRPHRFLNGYLSTVGQVAQSV